MLKLTLFVFLACNYGVNGFGYYWETFKDGDGLVALRPIPSILTGVSNCDEEKPKDNGSTDGESQANENAPEGGSIEEQAPAPGSSENLDVPEAISSKEPESGEVTEVSAEDNPAQVEEAKSGESSNEEKPAEGASKETAEGKPDEKSKTKTWSFDGLPSTKFVYPANYRSAVYGTYGAVPYGAIRYVPYTAQVAVGKTGPVQTSPTKTVVASKARSYVQPITVQRYILPYGAIQNFSTKGKSNLVSYFQVAPQGTYIKK